MAHQSARAAAGLSGVFHTLADPARRAIVGALGCGPEAVSVLEHSGLVRSSKQGRVCTCELVPKALSQAGRWPVEQRAVWEARSDRMALFVETLHQEELSRDKPQAQRRR
ncbi:MAG: transcriptional regulator [Rubrivivax sp.]